MPIIKVWCLPKMEEYQLRQVHCAIVGAVESVKELKLDGMKDVTCLFPPDSMAFGLGTEVVIEVTGLFKKPGRTREVRRRLAKLLGQAVADYVPKAKKVECLVYPPFNPAEDGFWSGKAEEDER